MPMKIRSTSSSAIVFGCRCPTLFFFAGSVTSITSAFSLISRSICSICFFASSMTRSISALVSLTSWPNAGRSSGAISFILFKRAVSSPFFPSMDTRTSFKASGFLDALIFSIASSLILCNLSFISVLLPENQQILYPAFENRRNMINGTRTRVPCMQSFSAVYTDSWSPKPAMQPDSRAG